MTQTRGRVVVAGLMLSLFLVSMESTVVSTGMPTIVSQLGGLEAYSWVFTVYMLASTTTVPLYGKLSDLFGRRPVYAAAMAIFLLGSLLCGAATSMPQLIAFRVVQGLGGGGLMPLVFIIIGDLFTLEQRARLQGLFSGVWGVSSLVGPLLGGFLVDQVSWRWVFLINLFLAPLAFALVWGAWVDRPRPSGAQRPPVDYAGALLLTGGAVALLLGLSETGAPWAWGAFALALALFALLVWAERRAADPVLPIGLFRERLFAVACSHGVLVGCAMFGSASFVPLFAQGVLGTSATGAGAALTPMMLGWVFASIVGTRLLLHIGYRTLALAGTGSLTAGTLALTQLSQQTGLMALMVYLALMGIGMGLCVPAFLIAVQSTVERRKLGTATSTLTFSRSIGGALGVGVMGALLSAGFAASLAAAGLDPAAVSLDGLLDRAGGQAALGASVQAALSAGTRNVFVLAFAAAALGLGVTALAPRGRIGEHQAYRAEEAPRPSAAGE
ncbi:MAG TPA: MDR family MFS transporter [Roseiflexaceae bacterium]|nr:MDR family MFS transporter [Roseiflexaceae bacterium]